MRFALSIWAVLALAACGSSGPDARNALLITLDTTRADALGCYGNPIPTPTLDGLAREAIVFERAHSVAPLTLPAHASMLTGLVPLRHGVRDNGWSPLPQAARTLAERARAQGFQTAAFVAAAALDRRFALDQGFEVYDQPQRTEQQVDAHFAQRPAGEVALAAGRWLAERDRSRPFLLWVHFFDPHVPYAPPPLHAEAAGGNPYLGEVAYMDAVLGELLAPLRADGTLDETLIVVAGDHGESLGEHGEATHGAFGYEAALRVPLIVRAPDGRRAGERSRATASVVDVYPTVASALGLGAEKEIDGRDLLTLSEQEPRGVYFECYTGWLAYGWSQLAGWVVGGTKYVHSAAPELFDLERDPREERNLFRPDAVEVVRARAALAELSRRPRLTPEESAAPDPELLAAIAALGYAAGGPSAETLPDPLDATDRPAPHERAAELALLMRSNALAEARRFAEAADVLRALLDENPRHLLALDLLAFDLQQLDAWQEAHDVLETRLERGPGRVETWINLAVVLHHLGREEEIGPVLERALALDPGNERARLMLEGLDDGDGRR